MYIPTELQLEFDELGDVMRDNFPVTPASLSSFPSSQEDEKFFEDLPLAARSTKAGDVMGMLEQDRSTRPFSNYSFSRATLIDDNGKPVSTTRRRYEDASGRLKAWHERIVNGRKFTKIWNKADKADKGIEETQCSEGTNADEFEAAWKETPFVYFIHDQTEDRTSHFDLNVNKIMKLPSLLTLNLFVSNALSTSYMEDPSNHECHFYNNEEACIESSEGGEPCYWCKSAAVHSMCYNETEAKQLPPAIFQCDKKMGGVFDQNIINLADQGDQVIENDDGEFVESIIIVIDEEEIVAELAEFEMEDFSSEIDPQNEGCHSYNSHDSCLKNKEGGKPCYWCQCSAVPSSCYNETEALQLPPAVFQCEKENSWVNFEEIDWALTEMPNTFAMKDLYQLWKLKYKKDDDQNDEHRFNVFQENAKVVVAHNNKALSYTLELNRFADMPWSDFKHFYLGSLPQNCSATHTAKLLVNNDQVPEAIDWRRWGAVSPVKDQGMCGSCWTFSTTGCLESHNTITHGKKILLSEQNLIDCAQQFDNHGCDGGLPSHAFEYVKYNGGLDTGASYPYHAKDEKCKFSASSIGVKVIDVVNITSTDENELKAAVGTVGPVSIAFQVSSDFQLYKDGIYDSTQCQSGVQDVNHAVLAIGYNITEDGHKYWIVKNSWSAKWGMDGGKLDWCKLGNHVEHFVFSGTKKENKMTNSTNVKYHLVEAEEVDGQTQQNQQSFDNGSAKKKSFNNDAKNGGPKRGGARWKNQNGGGRGPRRNENGSYYNGVFIPNNDVNVTAEYAKQQIEFFLSPNNLVRDTFLRQHMDVDGYVPVAFVGSFQSVYSIHQDYPTLLAAMKTSTLLEFDEKNEKIRPHDWQKWLWPTADGQYGVPRYIKVDEPVAET